MSFRTGILCVLALLLAPAAADAATVDIKVGGSLVAPGGVLRFTAAPGERNDVTIDNRRGRWWIRDTGAILRATRDCRLLDAHTASCEQSEDLPIFELGDGDDRAVKVTGDSLHVLGGPGNDVLIGRSGYDTFFGGHGSDRLIGAGGNDTLDGGPGADRITGGTGDDTVNDRDDAADRIDLGRGSFDQLEYRGRRRDLRIDLSRGVTGDGDRIRGVEAVFAGRGDDRITGDSGRNTINGRGGEDIITGRGGDDRLTGGAGRDKLFGGAGSDQIASHDAAADTISCDAGLDDVDADVRDLLHGDCDLADGPQGIDVRPAPVISPGRADFTVRCEDPPCNGGIQIENVGSAPYGVTTPGESVVTVPFDAPVIGDLVVRLLRPDGTPSRYGFRVRPGT